MKYLCLVYLDEGRLDELPDEDCVAYDTAIRASGHCLASEALQSVRTATTVRVRSGKVSITDGPFAETKEQLAGFYVIEAKNLDEAIGLAAGIPPARVGSIEVRPIRPIRETVAAANTVPHAQPRIANARGDEYRGRSTIYKEKRHEIPVPDLCREGDGANASRRCGQALRGVPRVYRQHTAEWPPYRLQPAAAA